MVNLITDTVITCSKLPHLKAPLSWSVYTRLIYTIWTYSVATFPETYAYGGPETRLSIKAFLHKHIMEAECSESGLKYHKWQKVEATCIITYDHTVRLWMMEVLFRLLYTVVLNWYHVPFSHQIRYSLATREPYRICHFRFWSGTNSN